MTILSKMSIAEKQRIDILNILSASRYDGSDRRGLQIRLSMPEMARELGVPRGTVYSILKAEKNRDKLDIVVVAGRKRVTKESFESWYAGQDRYIKVSDRPAEEQKRSNGTRK